jgi:hypothetical protein
MGEVVIFVFKAGVHEAEAVALVCLDDIFAFVISRVDSKRS